MPMFTAHDGAALAYSDLGVGRPVVFLASWSLPGASWDYQIVPLAAEGYRCLCLDRRGHGRSEDPGRGYDMNTLAYDVGRLLEHLDLDDAVLVGFSVGAAEAVRAAGRYPGRVGGLVLVGTTTPYLPRSADSPHGIDPEIFGEFQRELLADFPNWIDKNIDPFAPGTSSGLKSWIKAMAMTSSLNALLHVNRTLTTEDARSELPLITVPTLVIHGDQDATSPLDLTGRPTAALIAGARLHIYEGAPHGLMYTHRERFSRDLLDFLGD